MFHPQALIDDAEWDRFSVTMIQDCPTLVAGKIAGRKERWVPVLKWVDASASHYCALQKMLGDFFLRGAAVRSADKAISASIHVA